MRLLRLSNSDLSIKLAGDEVNIFSISLKKYCLFIIFVCLISTATILLASQTEALAQTQQTKSYTLTAGVSIEHVPKDFYGTWRVVSNLTDTNNPEIFKQKNVDLWNLSRSNNVIKLENPFSGASASIQVDEVKGNFIRFQKVGDYDNRKLTDKVKLNLGKETFTGTNTLKLDTISTVDGHVIKTEWATYNLSGEKISGSSIK